MRHDVVDFHRAHALANGAFHAQQADAVLIFHQFADGAYPAVAEMVDIVDFVHPVLQADQGFHDTENILAAQHAHYIGAVEVEAHVHFHAPDGR